MKNADDVAREGLRPFLPRTERGGAAVDRQCEQHAVPAPPILREHKWRGGDSTARVAGLLERRPTFGVRGKVDAQRLFVPIYGLDVVNGVVLAAASRGDEGRAVEFANDVARVAVVVRRPLVRAAVLAADARLPLERR